MYEYYSSVDRIWLEQNLAVVLDQVLDIPIVILVYSTLEFPFLRGYCPNFIGYALKTFHLMYSFASAPD